MNRRHFCISLGAFGAAAARPDTVFSSSYRNDVHERNANALGTVVRILVRHRDAKKAQLATRAALDELELVESVMSIYRPESQLSTLNRIGNLRLAHPYLRRLLHEASDISIQTDGAFDITVQPLWKSYRDTTAMDRLPDSATINDARKKVGYQNVKFVGDGVRLNNAAQITLNGIAQGFATDRVKQVLLEHGIEDALIDIGELASLGQRDRDKPWTAGIQHPRHEGAFVAATPIGGRCLATSGDYATKFTSNFRVHHIFDPRTGVSPTELASVSVLAPTATEADALATAFVVMGLKKSAEMLANKRGVDAMFIRKSSRVSVTPGFQIKESI